MQNLTFDGVYFYQYDAWNRLVQVNFAHLGTGTPGAEPIVADALVKHYTDDGLGRMVRVVTPYPSPSTSNYQLRTERLYYDGVRRIQELVTDPVIDTKTLALEGDLEALAVLGNELDGDTLPTEGENVQMGGGGSITPVTYLDREYIWGPGGGGGAGTGGWTNSSFNMTAIARRRG